MTDLSSPPRFAWRADAPDSTALPKHQFTYSFKRGEPIYHAASSGMPWQVLDGVVRLDKPGADGSAFASLALPGDMIGCETLLDGQYAFIARAITPCTLVGQPTLSGLSPLSLLAAAEQRAADLVALRHGRATGRIRRLVDLLTLNGAQPLPGNRCLLPRLADIAEITGLAIETVSRLTGEMDMTGGLPHKKYRTKKIAPYFASAMAVTV